MTKKDYIAIARVFAQVRRDRKAAGSWTSARIATWTELCALIADTLHADNSHFDYKRFYAACEKE